jgi:hypothetical protein
LVLRLTVAQTILWGTIRTTATDWSCGWRAVRGNIGIRNGILKTKVRPALGVLGRSGKTATFSAPMRFATPLFKNGWCVQTWLNGTRCPLPTSNRAALLSDRL